MDAIRQMPELRAVADRGDQQRMLSVVIADDHALMRQGLRRLLEGEEHVAVAAETTELEQTGAVVAKHKPDVLVLDMHLRDGSTLAVLRELRQRSPGTQIVIVSMDDTPALAQRALATGAIAYVLKEHADEDLAPAVRAAARGDEYLSPALGRRLATLRHALSEGRLTARESEVLRLIAFGHTNVEIARKLEVSPRTIETHRANIHEKLALRTRAELVRYALRTGLLAS